MLNSRELAKKIRVQSLRMVSRVNASHIGSCLSMADLLAILYSGILRVDPARPEWPGRDRFILSKGHGAAILYAVLAESGFFPVEQLEEFCLEGSALTGHINHAVPGVEVSTGSLGHGLPIGCGMALAARSDGADWRAVVLLSDGELDEGSNWEAILFAAHHRLENLVAIVDFNKIQSFGSVKEVLDLDPLPAKWEAFGWGVAEIDGHDHGEIERHLKAAPFQPGKPSVLIAHTVKGKGISFMENALPWHYRAPDAALLEKALEELN